MKLFSRFVIGTYIVSVVGLFLYSYTQVDLSLTLSRSSIFQVVEKAFQYIGYFQRPLSTGLFLLLVTLLVFCYVSLLILSSKKILSRKIVWRLAIFGAVVLTFSYNAFSYDLFNYIFDAKIITHYFQNPYLHRALDYPHDPMLSFMHWTQRTYPYGPIWLVVTVPFSFIGMQFFLPTFYLFKLIASAGYLITAWCIEKILNKIKYENSVFGIAIFTFSPFVLIEGLVSAHNDMTMVMFSSLAVLAIVNKKNVWSTLLLFISIGIKFATAVLLPVWIALWVLKKEKNVQFYSVISFFLLIIPVIAASIRTNFQPWYLLFLFPFVSLMPKRKELLVGFSVFSIASLFQYIPFLYTGNWNPPIPSQLTLMLWASLIISTLATGITWLFMVAKRK